MADDKIREALEAAIQNFENIYTQYHNMFSPEIREIYTQTIMDVQEALKSEPEKVRYFNGDELAVMNEAQLRAYLQRLQNIIIGLKNNEPEIPVVGVREIKQQLLELPEQIKTQTLLIADQTADVENLRLKVAEIASAVMQEVADNLALKNETMRRAERERLLKANTDYIEKSKELRAKEQTLNVQRVYLEYLHNMFAAYRSIAGMGAKA